METFGGVWPEQAVGGWLPGWVAFTVIVMVSGALVAPSLSGTIRVKV
jgi:hypothetical protein